MRLEIEISPEELDSLKYMELPSIINILKDAIMIIVGEENERKTSEDRTAGSSNGCF